MPMYYRDISNGGMPLGGTSGYILITRNVSNRPRDTIDEMLPQPWPAANDQRVLSAFVHGAAITFGRRLCRC